LGEKTEVLQSFPERALVVVTFATDENGRPIARLVHLEKAGDAWRVDDVTDPRAKIGECRLCEASFGFALITHWF
jgi:hypothetical protein